LAEELSCEVNDNTVGLVDLDAESAGDLALVVETVLADVAIVVVEVVVVVVGVPVGLVDVEGGGAGFLAKLFIKSASYLVCCLFSACLLADV